MRNLVAACFCAALLAAVPGCKYPAPAKVEQKDTRPAIGIAGAPKGAELYVDGVNMGPARDYDGKSKVLLVESGNHLVEVKSASGEVLLSEKVFLGSLATKVFKIQSR